jgi:hypothetical protein
MSFEDVVQEIRAMTTEEQKNLLGIITRMLNSSEQPARTRSLLEFEGVGKALWDGTDAQEYVNQLRSEWDQQTGEIL